MRDWALSSLYSLRGTRGPAILRRFRPGERSQFGTTKLAAIRNHKASSNTDKFTKNFTLLDHDRESRADSCKAIRPSAGGAAGAKSRRFLARRGVKEALDDEACRPLRT